MHAAGKSSKSEPKKPQGDDDSDEEPTAISEKALVEGQALEGKQSLSHRIGQVKDPLLQNTR